MDKNNIIVQVLSFLIISFLLIIILYPFGNYATFWGDDGWFTLYHSDEKLFDILTFDKGHGSGYIGAFLNKIFSFYISNTMLLNV